MIFNKKGWPNQKQKRRKSMLLNSSELSYANRCSFRRDKGDLTTKAEKTNVYYKASIMKDAIRSLLEKKKEKELEEEDWKTAWVKIREKFNEMTDYPLAKTADLHAKDAYKQVKRYVDCEKRIPAYLPPETISLSDDLQVRVSPDMVFFTDEGIELVKIKTGKPNVAQKGSIRDKSVNNSLELYSLFCYGKNLVPKGVMMKVKASYYFLRKSSDSSSAEKPNFDLDFFDTKGAGNIVTLEQDVIGGGDTCLMGFSKKQCMETGHCDECPYPQLCEYVTGYTEKDALFASQVEAFVDGEDKDECPEEACETCDFAHICSYKLPPKYIEKEKTVKSIRDLNLTKAQEDAVYFKEGICRINAGAGAGKTLVVALRVATLLSEGVKPEEILLLTFTNTGAEEMRTRVKLYNEDFGNDADVSLLRSTTFNAFGDVIIKENYQELGFDEEPRLIDDVEKCRIIIDLLHDNTVAGLDYRNFDVDMRNCKGALGVTKKCFDIIKTYGLNTGDGETLYKKMDMNRRFMASNSAEEIIALFAEYERILRERNLIEFADQECLVFELLRKNPYYFEDLGIKHIIVDEFQDSNEGQIKLIKELVNCPAFESLMVVGDDSQAIFSFRDTSPEFIINFFDIMGEPNGTDLYLLENHRSTPEIIEFANEINSKNVNRVAKNLIATRPSGKPVIASGFFSKKEEYDYILDKIQQKLDSGICPEDIAFIASNKFELLEMGNLLTENNIPWIMLNPEQYLENSRVVGALDLIKSIEQTSATKGILSYLNCLYENKLMAKKEEEIKQLVEDFQKKLRMFQTLPDVVKMQQVKEWLEAIDDEDEVYESFIDTLMFRSSTQQLIEYCKDFEKYGSTAAIRRCRDYPGIVLTTAHSSKGLEWPVVFNSISKYYTPDVVHKLPRLEEKRRLLFVSATRARDELYITGQYVAFGTKEDRTYNLFLKECYDALGMEFNPIDPLEIEKKRMKEQEKADRKAERERKKMEKEAEKSAVKVTKKEKAS